MGIEEKDIDEEMIKDNTIFMSGEFNEKNTDLLVKKLLYLNSKDCKKEIILYVDSYGGGVYEFFKVYNIINSLKMDVSTIALGKAMSAGADLLLCGTKGKRYAYEYTQILIHELSYGLGYSKLNQHENELKHSIRLEKILDEIMIKNTKLKKEDLRKMRKDDNYLSAEQALKFGIIDKIL